MLLLAASLLSSLSACRTSERAEESPPRANLQASVLDAEGTIGVVVGFGEPGTEVELFIGDKPGRAPLMRGQTDKNKVARLQIPPEQARSLRGQTIVAQVGSGPDAVQTNPRALPLTADPPSEPRNVLVLLLDDVGTEKLAAYGSTNPAITPSIDALQNQGVTFDAAYTRPVCVAARAAIQTGRLGRRTGIGINWRENDPYELPLAEITLAEMVALSPLQTYTTAYTGKWHLSTIEATGFDHPLQQGWGFYAGAFGNLFTLQDGMLSYTDWRKVEGGVEIPETQYATSDTVDDAIAQLGVMPEPWLLFVAFNAAHPPMELPPSALVPVSSAAGDGFESREMIGAVDTEIGRLFAAIDRDVRDRTTVIFTADNGTPHFQRQEPLQRHRAKGTLFDGGVRVPLIIAGAGITEPGTRSDALVDLVDLFPTIAHMAGVDLSLVSGGHDPSRPLVIDGLDLGPLLEDPDAHHPRPYAYSDLMGPPGAGPYTDVDRQMLRDGRYKLIVDHNFGDSGLRQFFEYLPGATDEGPNLLACGMTAEQEAAYNRLSGDLLWYTEGLEFDTEPFPEPDADTGGAFSEFPLDRDTGAPDCGP